MVDGSKVLRAVGAAMAILCLANAAAAQMLLTLTMGKSSARVEIADTELARRNGLMHRESMPADQGMLFSYDRPRRLSFWMKNTKIPLDIAFIDEGGVIFQIEQMQPFDEGHTVAVREARFALEMNAGWFKDHGVRVGDKVAGLPK